MSKNDPIEIRPAGNGFIVTPIIGKNEMMADGNVQVFRSMAELCSFMEEHFSHRGKNLESDS